jgi:hypothetical protein
LQTEGVRKGMLSGHDGNESKTRRGSRTQDYLQGGDAAREERAKAAAATR